MPERLREVERRHAHGEDRPLGAYAGLLAGYGGMVAGITAAVRRRRAPLPDRVGAADLALWSVATFRLSRLLTKDSVTAVVRAPFTRYEEAAGEGEVNESVDAQGAGHAVGELLSCPFCVSVWLASALAGGMVLSPRLTRLVAATLTAVTASDWLQLAYAATREHVGG